MTITAAADGSALGNPGPAGWAWYVDDDHWAAGGWAHATNNRGELQAVLELFLATAHLDDDLLVLCDSQYVINSVTKWMRGWKAKGWRKGDGKPVMNVDLLQELDAALDGRRYRFEWVKGHANHPLNEAADTRARGAAEAFQRKTKVPAGPGWAGEAEVEVGDLDKLDQRKGVDQRKGHPADGDQRDGPEIEPRIEPRIGAGQADVALFDFDEAASDLVEVIVTLTPDEHARLTRRARLNGLGPEELLRSLI